MIPLRDENPTKKTPIVNRLLIVANILVWIYVLTLVRSSGAVSAFYDQYSFDWAQFVSQIAQGQIGVATFLPLFSHMFVHGGWLHVIGNMVYLWIFGDNIEERLGSGPYFVFYILCGIVAAIGRASSRVNRWSARQARSRGSSAPTSSCSPRLGSRPSYSSGSSSRSCSSPRSW